MKTITFHRKQNFMLAARKFKILTDGKPFDSIGNDETKQFEIPEGTEQVTVKIMGYVSKPIFVETIDSNPYTIKQNLLSTINTYLMMIFVVLYAFSKYVEHNEKVLYLYLAVPFLIISLYFMTFGRKNVIQIRN